MCENSEPEIESRPYASGEVCVLESSNTIEPSEVTVDDYHKILVLDLDETLIHTVYDENDYYDFRVDCAIGNSVYPLYVRKRPGLDAFLQAALEIYNVYIYTSSILEYASSIVQKLIPGFPNSKILHRDHCKYVNGNFIKQLSLFRKDMSQIIIVDDKSVSFCLNPNNGIMISSWVGDQTDDKLLSVTWPLLEKCSESKDVRSVIRQFYRPRRRNNLF